MKKLFSMACCTLMAVSVLTGCGSKEEEYDLTIAGLNGGYGKAGWEEVVKKFEKMENVKVKLTMEKNIAEVLRPQVTAGDVPDVIYLSIGAEGGLTDAMVKEKNIKDISKLADMKVPGEDVTVDEKVLPGFLDSITTKPYNDGKLYLAPLNYGPCGLFYNQGLFKEKGWSVPTTWDEMWALGDKAKAEGIALFTYPTTGYFDAFFSALLNETAGPDAYAKAMNYDVETWKSPEVKAAFEIVGKLASYTEANTVTNANKDNFAKNQQLVLDNKALFVPNGTWLPSEMAEAPRAEGFEWGFMALPKATANGDSYSTTFTEQMYVPKDAKNADLAMKFLAYCYSDEAAEIFYTKGKSAVMPITTASSLIPEKDKDGNPDMNKFFYSIYDTGAKANTVGFAAAETVEGVSLTTADGILYGTVNSVVNGTKSVDEWYNDVIAGVQKISDANAAAAKDKK